MLPRARDENNTIIVDHLRRLNVYVQGKRLCSDKTQRLSLFCHCRRLTTEVKDNPESTTTEDLPPRSLKKKLL